MFSVSGGLELDSRRVDALLTENDRVAELLFPGTQRQLYCFSEGESSSSAKIQYEY